MSRLEELEKLTDELSPAERDALLAKLLQPSSIPAEPRQVQGGAGLSVPDYSDDDGMGDVLDEIANTVPEPTKEQVEKAAAQSKAMDGHTPGVDLFAPSANGATKIGRMASRDTSMPKPLSQRSLDDEMTALTADITPPARNSQGPLPPPPEDQVPVRARAFNKPKVSQDLPPLPRNSTRSDSR